MNVEMNIHEWIRIAELDLATARHMFETFRPIPTEIVCFHSQQSAEKMLKCFLVYNNIEAPKIHDLVKLLEMCIGLETGFRILDRQAAFLNRFSVIPRYPNEIELIEKDGEIAIKYCTKVMDFVKNMLSKGNDKNG